MMDKTAEPVVTTTAGKVEGYYKNGLYIFKGIPYAAPPTGELRWLPPEPVKPWQGLREAKQFSAVAPQRSHFNTSAPQRALESMSFNAPVEQSQSEDCLYLNIWTPGLDNKKRPVRRGAKSLGSCSRRRDESAFLSLPHKLSGSS